MKSKHMSAEEFAEKLNDMTKNEKAAERAQTFEQELNADQLKRQQKSKKMAEDLKRAKSNSGLTGYHSWDVALFELFKKIYDEHKLWEKSPRYDLTLSILKTWDQGKAMGKSAIQSMAVGFLGMFDTETAKKLSVAIKDNPVTIEYTIDINKLNETMIISNGKKINQGDALHHHFIEVVEQAIEASGYTKTANGFEDSKKVLLTQEIFDEKIAPKLKEQLEQGLIVHDTLEQSASFKP